MMADVFSDGLDDAAELIEETADLTEHFFYDFDYFVNRYIEMVLSLIKNLPYGG